MIAPSTETFRGSAATGALPGGHGSEIVGREPSGALLELGVATMVSAIESS
jgi:hypothetical protein